MGYENYALLPYALWPLSNESNGFACTADRTGFPGHTFARIVAGTPSEWELSVSGSVSESEYAASAS
jgi:hypothetical protein